MSTKPWRDKTHAWLDMLEDTEPGVAQALRKKADKCTFREFKEAAKEWGHPVPDNLPGSDKSKRTPSLDYVDVLEVFDNEPEWDGVLGYDEAREEVVYLKQPPTECAVPIEVSDDPLAVPPVVAEEHVTRFGSWFRKARKAKVTIPALQAAVLANAKRQSFDWFRDRYLSQLKEWDSVERLSTTLPQLFGVPKSDVLSGMFFEKWMIAAVQRTLNPGCKVDNMLMLIGGQSVGKSEGISKLLPIEDLFAMISGKPHDKDTIYQLLGCKFACLDELMNFNDFRAWKSYTSAKRDKQRLSFGRRAVDIPRRFVWVGITNEPQFLTDVTGNRRYWPIPIPPGAMVNWDGIVEHRDRLWAEAYYLAQKHEPHWLTRKEEARAQARQRDFMVDIPYADDVRVLVKTRTTRQGKMLDRTEIRLGSGCFWESLNKYDKPTGKDFGEIRRAFIHVGLEPYGAGPLQVFPLEESSSLKRRCWIPSEALYAELEAERVTDKAHASGNTPEKNAAPDFEIDGNGYTHAEFRD